MDTCPVDGNELDDNEIVCRDCKESIANDIRNATKASFNAEFGRSL